MLIVTRRNKLQEGKSFKHICYEARLRMEAYAKSKRAKRGEQ